MIYSDGPGNKGQGGSGVAVLPEDDLLGLVGQHPEQKSVKRWIAGLGHELGHAFGLEHPRDTEKYGDALMWAGIYGKYPDQTYLTAEDKAILLKSPFFFHPNGDPVVKPAQSAETVERTGDYVQQSKVSPCWWSGRVRPLKKCEQTQYLLIFALKISHVGREASSQFRR